jgi:cell division protein FtsZ
MTSFNTKSIHDLRPKITVIGIGGAGGNAVNNMIRSKLEGVEFIVGNTDAQALEQSLVDPERRMQLGLNITQGLGAGSKPDVGRAAAEESIEEVIQHLQGSNMVFITAGMGGGTGTGAAPVIARAARESGILTVGVVSKPFNFEGKHRCRTADQGIEELQQYVDTLIVIPNQNLFRIATENTTFADAFKLADDVLYSGVRGVTDLMIMPGLINLDFADIRAVMAEMGKAMMGTGEAEGDRRALDAAEAAISNPLLDDVSMKGARGVLINITGGYDMTLWEADEAANRIRDDVDPDANIIFGSTFDEKLNGRIRVSVVATGIGESHYHANSTQAPQQASSNNLFQQENTRSSSSPSPMPQSNQFNFSPTRHSQAPMPEKVTQTPLQPNALRPNLSQSHHDHSAAPSAFDHASSHYPSHSPDTKEVAFTKKDMDNYYPSDQKNHEETTSFDFKEDKSKEEKTKEDKHIHTMTPRSKQEEREKNTHGHDDHHLNLDDASAPQKKRAPSLFERFTSVGRNRQSTSESDVRVNKLSNSETSVEGDEDDLEIPAFLRRENG